MEEVRRLAEPDYVPSVGAYLFILSMFQLSGSVAGEDIPEGKFRGKFAPSFSSLPSRGAPGWIVGYTCKLHADDMLITSWQTTYYMSAYRRWASLNTPLTSTSVAAGTTGFCTTSVVLCVHSSFLSDLQKPTDGHATHSVDRQVFVHPAHASLG